jgi:hypothetical protein
MNPKLTRIVLLSLLVVLVVSTLLAVTAKPEPAQTWEYKHVKMQNGSWSIRGAEYEKELNKLGAEGWELAAPIGSRIPGKYLIFKRPAR